MKIGILSDTHGSRTNTQRALATLRERGIDTVIHCGDITTPEVVLMFAGWDARFVFGNMDLDRSFLIQAAQRVGVAVPQFTRDVEIDGRLIGVAHGHDHSLLYRMIISGKYTYVCQGHTHVRQDERRGAYSVRLINPGSLGGNFRQTRSIAVLDVETDNLEFIEFPEMV